MILNDPAAERAVVAGVLHYGAAAYFDIADIISNNTFTVDSNSFIFKCAKHAIDRDAEIKIDIPTIFSAAQELGLSDKFVKTEEVKHLHAVFSMPVQLANVRKFAAKIRKLEIARLLHGQLEVAQDKLGQIRGDETITHILGIAEDSIFDFTSLLNDSDEEPELMTDGLTEYLEYLAANPVESIGISTGYPVYDKAIGGGLRNGTVNMIGARPKTGKSVLAMNIGSHISKNINIPVLYLDTEMMKEDQVHRMVAMLTETPINEIETGKFGESVKGSKIIALARELQDRKTPFYYKNISGKPFEDILAIMRRWLIKKVGLDDNGKAKPCVIVYDYLKLMSDDGLMNLQEYQLLGFMMTGLHNFAVRYKLPVLSFMQLNRDGINKESTDVASGSDRIIWLCSNFSIYKKKSDEEIAESGKDAGNRKMVPIVSRHGGDWNEGDYINMHMQGQFAKIVEGHTAYEEDNEDGFIVDENEELEEIIPY